MMTKTIKEIKANILTHGGLEDIYNFNEGDEGDGNLLSSDIPDPLLEKLLQRAKNSLHDVIEYLEGLDEQS